MIDSSRLHISVQITILTIDYVAEIVKLIDNFFEKNRKFNIRTRILPIIPLKDRICEKSRIQDRCQAKNDHGINGCLPVPYGVCVTNFCSVGCD